MRIKNNLSRICYTLIILSIISILNACTTTYRANSLYEKGQYVQSVRIITDKLDRTKQWPEHKLTAQKMTDIIHGSIHHFEQHLANSNHQDFDNKIYAYKGLLQIRELLDHKFYSNRFNEFVSAYNISALKQNIAEQYYFKGNAVKPVAIIDYKTKANIYAEGLNYADYKDMRVLQQKYAKQYATLAAEDAYKKGKNAAAEKQYKAASEYFAQSRDFYKAYGAYKDSHEQFIKYDKLWRIQAAQTAFNQAAQKGNNAQYKSDHRSAASMYLQAYNYYKPYGDFKNSQGLYQKHKELGTVYITTHIEGNTTDRDIDKRLKKLVENKFKDGYYRVAQNGARRDIDITISYRTYYNDEKEKQHRRHLQDKDESGNTLNFTEHTLEKQNRYRIELKLRASGKVSFSDQFTLKASSFRTETSYSGQVPLKYTKQANGSLKTRAQLERSLENDLDAKINEMLSSIYYDTERL